MALCEEQVDLHFGPFVTQSNQSSEYSSYSHLFHFYNTFMES